MPSLTQFSSPFAKALVGPQFRYDIRLEINGRGFVVQYNVPGTIV